MTSDKAQAKHDRAMAKAVEDVEASLRAHGAGYLAGPYLSRRIEAFLAEEADRRHLSAAAVLRRFFDADGFAQGEIALATLT